MVTYKWLESKRSIILIMRLIDNKTVTDFERLININLEVLSGYKFAAEIINDKNLREVFIIYIQRLSEYMNELKRIEKDWLGNKKKFNYPERKFSFLSCNNEITILRMCANLEEKSIKEYEIILHDEIPSNIKDMFLKQYNGVREVQLHMNVLGDKYYFL